MKKIIAATTTGGILGAAAVAAVYESYLDGIHTHPGFRILSGAGLRHKLARLRAIGARHTYDVVCGDFDRMKILNDGPEGYAFTDRLIGRTFDDLRVRCEDKLLIGQGMEGDEFVIVVARRSRSNPLYDPAEIPGLIVAHRMRLIAARIPIDDEERIRIARQSAGAISGLSATITVVANVTSSGVATAISRGLAHVKSTKYEDRRSGVAILY